MIQPCVTAYFLRKLLFKIILVTINTAFNSYTMVRILSKNTEFHISNYTHLNMKVLFIQEQTFLATALRLAFIKKGYDIRVSSENIPLSITFETFNPNIVIADISKGRGYYYVEEAKKKNVPVIVISNNTGTDHFQMAIEKGADDCLQMPLSFSDLLQRVNLLTKKKPFALLEEAY